MLWALLVLQTPEPERNALPDRILEVLRRARSFDLVSVDPVQVQGKPGPYFGLRVLGKARIGPKADQATLVRALSKGIKDAPRDVYLCFSPRHAIHASDGKTTVDVLVCFECLNGRYESPGLRGSFRINTYPEPVFNAFLKAAGVPLAPKER